MKEVMLDIETMGRGNNAAIVSIGAVMFHTVDYEVLRPFYRTVDLDSSIRWGLDVTGETIMWWMEQSDAARKALKENPHPKPLEDVLMEFREWFGADKPIWGHGATFDLVILQNAYNKCRMRCPWTYKSERCYRTMKAMYPGVELPPDSETPHQAHQDAQWQAEHLMNIMKRMRSIGE